MRRRVFTVVLGVLIGVLVGVTPAPSVATTRNVPMRVEHATAGVTATKVFGLDRPADHLAIYWRGNPHAHVSLAFSLDGSRFGPDVSAGRDEVGMQRQNGTTYGAIHDSFGTVAVRVNTDRPISHLTVLAMADGAATIDRSLTAADAQASTDQPPVLSRSQWGADPQYMTWTPQFYPTKKLVVHHTATSNDYADRAGAESQVRSIYYYHSVTQGWGDIGYNFLIDKFGNVYEGRYSREYGDASPSGDDAYGNGVTGAHTSGWNSGTVGVAMLGTFTDRDVTPAARDALEALLAWKANRHGIDPQATQPFVNPVSGATTTTPNIAAHRDYAATECPGGMFYGTLPEIRSDVAGRIAGSGTADTTAPTPPSNVTASGGTRRVTLSWAQSSDEVGVAGYRIMRSRSSSGTFSQVASVGGTSYVDGSLARRTTYYYKIKAYDAAGNVSSPSGTAFARTS